LVIRRVHHMHTQAPQVTKNLDRHSQFSDAERLWVKQRQVVDRPVVEALNDTVRIRLHPYAGIPDRLKATITIKACNSRPEISMIVFRIDPDTPLRRVEL